MDEINSIEYASHTHTHVRESHVRRPTGWKEIYRPGLSGSTRGQAGGCRDGDHSITRPNGNTRRDQRQVQTN